MNLDTYLRHKTFRYSLFVALILATCFWVFNYEQTISDSDRAPSNSVWVLRFVAAGNSEREIALAYSLPAEVTHRLSNYTDISVVSVVDAYPTKHEEISSDFHTATFVVEGFIQIVDGQAVVEIYLFDLYRNEYLWHNEYTASLSEHAEDEDPLLSQIVRDIHASVSI